MIRMRFPKGLLQNGFLLMAVGLALFFFVGSINACTISVNPLSWISYMPCLATQGMFHMIIKMSGLAVFLFGVKKVIKR